MQVNLPPEYEWLWLKTSGAKFTSNGEEALLGGEYSFVDFSEAAQHYRSVLHSSRDSDAPLEGVFPAFLSHWNERLGPTPQGQCAEVFEVSLSLQPAHVAFSSLEMALHVFAEYFQACGDPLKSELDTFQRIHRKLDPKAAETYWI